MTVERCSSGCRPRVGQPEQRRGRQEPPGTGGDLGDRRLVAVGESPLPRTELIGTVNGDCVAQAGSQLDRPADRRGVRGEGVVRVHQQAGVDALNVDVAAVVLELGEPAAGS